MAVELRAAWSEYAVAEEYGFAIPRLRLDCFCRWDLNGAIIPVWIKPRALAWQTVGGHQTVNGNIHFDRRLKCRRLFAKNDALVRGLDWMQISVAQVCRSDTEERRGGTRHNASMVR